MSDKLEAIRALGSDKFTIEMFREDTEQMIGIVSNYLYDGVNTHVLEMYVSIYADKVEDVHNYIKKWEHRVEMFKRVIDHMQSENFTAAVNMPGASKREIYAEYLPVIQSLYNEKEIAAHKVKVAKAWLDACGILYRTIGGEECET